MNRAGYVLVLLLLLVAGGRLAVATANHTSLIANEIYKDDAFYYFDIAESVMSGRGFTVDGSARTNGFQPLYLLLLLPLVGLSAGDPILPLHLAGVLAAMISVATAWLLFRLTGLTAGRATALFVVSLWAITPYFIVHDVNGQETAIATFFAVLIVWFYLARVAGAATPTLRDGLLLGLLAGLAVLARLDNVLLLAAIGAHSTGAWLRGGRDRGRALVLASVVLAALATCLPWIVFSRLATGDALPLSGRASRQVALNVGWWNLRPIWFPPDAEQSDSAASRFFDPDQPPARYYADVATRLVFVGLLEFPPLAPLRANSVFAPHPRLLEYVPYGVFLRGPRIALSLVAAITVIGATIAFTRRRRRQGAGGTTRHVELETLGRIVSLYGLAMFGAYTFYCPAHWNFNRYALVPLLLGTVLVAGHAAHALTGHRGRRWAAGLGLLLLACQLNNLRFFTDLRWSEVPPRGFLQAWQAIESQVEPDATLGAFQSGVLGYFSRREVINLDGKVNRDAFRALQERRVGAYIDGRQVDYVMDWDWIVYALYLRHEPEEARRLVPVRLDRPSAGVRLYRVLPRPGQTGERESTR